MMMDCSGGLVSLPYDTMVSIHTDILGAVLVSSVATICGAMGVNVVL